MKLPRRKFLHLATGAAALPALPRIASALDYPTRPVRIIVGFPAGGTGDIVARLMGQRLSNRLGQQFIIENRPGAGSNIAAEAVVRAPPDGYTLLLVSTTTAYSVTLYENLNFNPIRDIVPVAGLGTGPGVMVVSPSFPAKDVVQFIAYAKANPGKISMATSGAGSGGHVWGELFKMMAGVDMVAVPFRGEPQEITELIAGRIQVMFDPIVGSLEQIRAGMLRALAVTTATRYAALPNTPTVAEFVPGYEAISWTGIGAPKNTPTEIVEKLNKEINAGLNDPAMVARLTDIGNLPMPMTPAKFGRFIVDETDKWGRVIRAANIKPE